MCVCENWPKSVFFPLLFPCPSFCWPRFHTWVILLASLFWQCWNCESNVSPHRRRRHRRCAKFDCCNSRNLIIYIIRILLIELSYASPNTTRINLEKKKKIISLIFYAFSKTMVLLRFALSRSERVHRCCVFGSNFLFFSQLTLGAPQPVFRFQYTIRN